MTVKYVTRQNDCRKYVIRQNDCTKFVTRLYTKHVDKRTVESMSPDKVALHQICRQSTRQNDCRKYVTRQNDYTKLVNKTTVESRSHGKMTADKMHLDQMALHKMTRCQIKINDQVSLIRR